jgi:putative transposase
MVCGKDAEFSITQQCKMLGIQRSGVYYKPAKASDRDLEIMKVMDTLYTEDPARGTRRYRDDLRQLGHVIGRDKVRSLMRIMGIEAIIDIYSRYIVGWSISNTIEAKWVVETVEAAVERYGKPEIINSHQGAQFTSEVYVNYI